MATTVNAKTVVSVATSATTPANAAAYKALSWTAVGGVTDAGGEISDEYNMVTAKVLGTRRELQQKGSIAASTIEIVVLYDAADAGQTALRTALSSDAPIYIRIELGDKPSTGTTPTGSIMYLPVVCAAAPIQHGESDNYVGQKFKLAIVGDPVTVAPSTGA